MRSGFKQNAFQGQADPFPWPAISDTASHPVIAWYGIMLVRSSWEVANVSQIVWTHIVWLRWCPGFQPQLYACHFVKMETSNARTSVSVYFDSWALNRLFLTETSGHNDDLVIPCTVSVSFPFDILLPISIKCDVTPIKMLFTLK